MRPWESSPKRRALSPRKVIVWVDPRPILLLLFFFAVLYGLYLVRDVLFILFLSGMLATALYPLVNTLKKRHFSGALSIILLYLIFIIFMLGVIFLMGSLLIQEGRQFLTQLPGYFQSALKYLSHLPFFPSHMQLMQPLSQLSRNTETIVNQLMTLLQSTVNYLFLAVSGVLGIFTVFVLAFYLVIDASYFEKFLMAVIPSRHQKTARELLIPCIDKIGRYVRGQLTLMLVVGLVVWVGLTLLGIPNALVLALIAFMLEVVPILGPIVSAFFGILVAFGQSPMMVLWVGLFYLVVQQSESYFLTPKIFGNSVELHPFWIFVSILIGGSFAGLPGVIIAIPIAVIISILVQELYIRRFLRRINAGLD